MFISVLLIAGLVFLAAGLVQIFTAAPPKPDPEKPKTESLAGDVGEALKQLNALLDKLEQRFRLGVVLIAVGLTLVGLAAYFEAKQAKDDAKDAKNATAALVLRVT